MIVADEQAYEEVISRLTAYVWKVNEASEDIRRTAEDCVDNTEGDPAAVKSSEDLQVSINNIEESLEQIQKVIEALAEQLERIRTAHSSIS